MRNLFVFLIPLTFAATTLLAHQVTFVYESTEGYSTNYMTNVASGETFTAKGSIPSDRAVTEAYWNGKHPQEDRKSISLFVGIDEYDPESVPDSLDTCVNDSQCMAEAFAEFGYFDENNYTILNDKNATKTAIRGKIAEAAEALNPNDIFLYYHSSHGGDEPYCLYTYDGTYLATELAEDLSKFKDGVSIIVILDSCYSAGMIPPEAIPEAIQSEMVKIKAKRSCVSEAQITADLKSDALFLASSQSDELSTCSYFFSLFTEGLYFSFDSLTDKDKNGVISFAELFDRAFSYTAKYEDQFPYISNPALGDMLFTSPIPQSEAYGFLRLKENFFTYTFTNVSQDLIIKVTDSPAPEKPNVSVSKHSVKTNFKDNYLDPLYPTKYDFAASYKSLSKSGKSAKESASINFDGILWVNEYPITLTQTAQLVKSNKKGTAFSADIMDYSFFKIGQYKVKINVKKGVIKLRVKLNEALDLYKVFDPLDQADQDIDLMLMLNDQAVSMPISVAKKSKPGKSFTAKLKKRK